MKQKALVEAALAKHGMASTASKAKRARMLESAEEEAAEALAQQERMAAIGEAKVHAGDLVGESAGSRGRRGAGTRSFEVRAGG